jgi:hypothetical protein
VNHCHDYNSKRIITNATNGYEGQQMVWLAGTGEEFCRDLNEFFQKFEQYSPPDANVKARMHITPQL